MCRSSFHLLKHSSGMHKTENGRPDTLFLLKDRLRQASKAFGCARIHSKCYTMTANPVMDFDNSWNTWKLLSLPHCRTWVLPCPQLGRSRKKRWLQFLKGSGTVLSLQNCWPGWLQLLGDDYVASSYLPDGWKIRGDQCFAIVEKSF